MNAQLGRLPVVRSWCRGYGTKENEFIWCCVQGGRVGGGSKGNGMPTGVTKLHSVLW